MVTTLKEEDLKRVAELLRERNIEVANKRHGVAHPRDSFYLRYGKRCIDVVFAASALVITLPINLVLAVATYLDVGRPIFFKQWRAGKDGVPFIIIKFRNMTNECDENGVLLPAEERVTKWGRFVRRTSLDELLNFWSILKGDMSVIGPRPLLLEYKYHYCDYHYARLAVRPGLECPPNPAMGDASTWEGAFNSDVWYVEHVSPLTDIKKLVRLVEAVFDKRSSLVRSSAGRTWFVGYDEKGMAMSLSDLSDELIDELLSGDADA